QLLWQLDNLGFGYAARVRERRSEHQLAILESLRLQDRVAAEVKQAYDQAQGAAARITDAEAGLKDALELVKELLSGFRQTRTIADRPVLIIRPQEIAAGIQTLSQAYSNYSAA